MHIKNASKKFQGHDTLLSKYYTPLKIWQALIVREGGWNIVIVKDISNLSLFLNICM